MTVVSKTEVNLRRLLAAAPHQENQAKLVHYVATLRELLEQLSEEKTPEGLPRISKAKVNEYSEKIQVVATKLATPVSDTEIAQESIVETSTRESSPRSDGKHILDSPGLRRRSSSVKERSHDTVFTDQSGPVKLDTAAQTHIAKHRKLQEDLTDEMVVLARQLKESSQMMSQSLKNTEKILDSTEKAVEHSLASTGHANTRAMEHFVDRQCSVINRDSRGNGSALFDNVEEGGIRAAASYSSHEIDEHENDMEGRTEF